MHRVTVVNFQEYINNNYTLTQELHTNNSNPYGNILEAENKTILE